jgi:hypothetical protein
MDAALDKETTKLADDIVNEFIRLKISRDINPYLGLMTYVPNITTKTPVVDIYSAYQSGFYDARKVLVYLKTTQPGDVSLHSEDTNSIWQYLVVFKV